MANSVSRRTLLIAGASTAASLSLPGAAADASASTRVGFRLDAEVLDGGEQITSITIFHRPAGPDRCGQPDDRYLPRARHGDQPDRSGPPATRSVTTSTAR
nr:hypothetical protein GCM10020092_076700 [Actinoplanes digitatis]